MYNFSLSELEQKRKSKEIRKVNPIKLQPGFSIDLSNLNKYIEEPLRKPMRKLLEKNIFTFDSSANMNDITNKSDAYILIEAVSLSKYNDSKLKLLSANFPGKIDRVENKGKKFYRIKMPMAEETTVGEVEDYFMDCIDCLKIQDVRQSDINISYSSIMQIVAQNWGCNLDEVNKEMIKMMGFVCHNGIWYKDEYTYSRHMNYLRSLTSDKNKKQRVI